MASVQVASKSMGVIAALTSIALVAAMIVTSPRRLGPAGVTLWFLGVWVALGLAAGLLLYRLGQRLSKQAVIASSGTGLQRALRRGVLMSTGVTILLGLSSLGQLDVRDIGLVTVLLVLTELYMRTRLA